MIDELNHTMKFITHIHTCLEMMFQYLRYYCRSWLGIQWRKFNPENYSPCLYFLNCEVFNVKKRLVLDGNPQCKYFILWDCTSNNHCLLLFVIHSAGTSCLSKCKNWCSSIISHWIHMIKLSWGSTFN